MKKVLKLTAGDWQANNCWIDNSTPDQAAQVSSALLNYFPGVYLLTYSLVSTALIPKFVEILVLEELVFAIK